MTLNHRLIHGVNGGPTTLHWKDRGIYFWTARVGVPLSAQPPLKGDIKLLGLSVLFLDRQNPDSTFFSLPVSHFPGCQTVVTWKQWQGRGGKHISLPMQIFLSATDYEFWAALSLCFDTIHSKLISWHALFSLAMCGKCCHNRQA